MNTKVNALLIVSAIVITVIFSIFYINNPVGKVKCTIEEGFLDLSGWDSSKELNINLDGEWEFYPGALLNPTEIKDGNNGQSPKFITVPGDWAKDLNEERSPEGSGTYRLIIRLKDDGAYAIKTRSVRLSSRVFLNGQEAFQVGRPSLNKQDYIGESRYGLGWVNSSNDQIEIIIQVSSYGHGTGGILTSIEFGTFESVMRRHNVSVAIDAMAIAVCLITVIYFFILFMQNRKIGYLLFFSVVSFAMAVYLSTMNEQFLYLVIRYDLNLRNKIQMTSLTLSAISLLQFISRFFKEKVNMKAVNICTGFCTIMLIITWLKIESSPNTLYAVYFVLITLGFTVCIMQTIAITIRAILDDAEGLVQILIITSSLVFYWMTIILRTVFEIYVGGAQIVYILFMMVGSSALITHRLNHYYSRASILTEKLIVYDKQRDEFLTKASQEMKIPLQIILGLTQNLVEGRKGSLNSKQQEDLIFIYQESQSLIRLLAHILNASHLKDGKLLLEIVSVNLYTIAEGILREMKIMVPENKPIELKNNIPEDFPIIKQDINKLRQIIFNLVHNAIRFTDKGEIALFAEIKDDFVEIIVSDTGIGIEKKDLEEIFTLFYQKNEELRSDRGLGLGLTVVKQLVTKQGGEVNVESTPGIGTSVKVNLPLYKEVTVTEEPKGYFENLSAREIILRETNNLDVYEEAPRVLLVDDNPLNIKIIMDILADLKWNITLAETGEKALEFVRNMNLDLVILDFMVPDISGERLCKEIRKIYSMSELPVLILTASESTVDLLKGFEHGANDFQKKPIDPVELTSRMSSLLLMKKTVQEGLERELKYFYSQISPHFLYNTINTIIGLSYEDDELARKALKNLAIYFRGKLDVHLVKGLIPLKYELELVTAYLEIEKLRYREKLTVLFDIDEDVNIMIPPLTIQPLVENAINHGIKRKTESGIVKISVKKEGNDTVKIIVEDTGVGMDEEKQAELLKGDSSHIGFRNVAEKVKRLKNARLTLESSVHSGTKVSIIFTEVK